jgi:hypothetical protein
MALVAELDPVIFWIHHSAQVISGTPAVIDQANVGASGHTGATSTQLPAWPWIMTGTPLAKDEIAGPSGATRTFKPAAPTLTTQGGPPVQIK